MAQTVPLTVRLGAANTGLALGYRILNLDRTVYSAFTVTGVVESTVLGTYSVDDGAIVPDAGGYVVWGTSGSDRLEGNIDPAASLTAITTALATLQADVTTIDNFLDTEIATIITNLATVDTVVDGIAADVDALGTSSAITVISAISGDDITVYQNDTWSFSATVTFALTAYEAVAFVVKRTESETDDEALLYLRSDTGLVRMNGAQPGVGSAPGTAADGVLTIESATEFSVLVAITQTNVLPVSKHYKWWLKVFDTTAAPDEGYTRATGKFIVKPYGLRAVA